MTREEYKKKLGRYTLLGRLEYLEGCLIGGRIEALKSIVGAIKELEISKTEKKKDVSKK